ncbi:esterase-like activity of phytase family protein [Gordonia soli]|uniref:Phytase-like domain-containing protein n=1 Tax=Gordonia soli NBRC 108243 TaxID=1223545 RepID=M0QF49_9ACTN|nr:esterase-like activity of phytase family protein [Gordonia soli]GAC67213.1 hypothetical protein GS4_06_00590 [Gordonia soli NBRC 108243]
MRIRYWGAALLAAVAVASSGAIAPASAAPAPSVIARYLNSVDVTPLIPAPLFGAISGIDSVGGGNYSLISTDVGRMGPARYYTARVPVDQGGQISGAPFFNGGGTVLGPGNIPVLPGGAQFEGIRKLGADYVVVSGGANQFVRVIGALGTFQRDLPLPRAYQAGRTTGLNGQRGLTGVAVGPRGQVSVLTAGGLKQDPGRSARLLTFGKRGTTEFVYRTDADKVAANVIAVNSTDYLVVERGKGRITRIYWTSTRGATNVAGKAKLSGAETPMIKKSVFSSAPVPRLAIGNVSGMAWGPWLPDTPWAKTRSRSLMLVTNDGFNGPTRLHALEFVTPKR